jgi:hypothetical protein
VIAIVLASIGGYSGQTSWDAGTDSTTIAIGGTPACSSSRRC